MFYLVKKIDWVLFASAVLLAVGGLVSIYSISLEENGLFEFKKQIVFLGVGIVVMFLLTLIDWRALQSNSYLILAIYFFSIVSLVGLFFLAPITRGVRGWYKIGFISLDPIPLVKLILIILLAKYFSKRHVEMYRLKHIILSAVYIILPVALIIFQPDLGSALILIGLWVSILIISGIRLRVFLILILCGILLATLSWFFLMEDYQKDRVMSFLSPDIDPQGIGWNQRQSKIAIGSGGLFGKGFGNASQAKYGFLPEPQTDFVFAAIAEEFGLTGVAFLFVLYLVLIWRIIKIAVKSGRNFPRLFASGFVVVLVFQSFIHIGMNLGILPVIGLSLPLVSYGGSGLISFFAGLGFIQSIKVH